MKTTEHEFPVRRHPDCTNTDCRICLDDHEALSEYIERQTGICDMRIDYLRQYKKWLDKNGILSETNGWASVEAWDKINVDAFIKNWMEET